MRELTRQEKTTAITTLLVLIWMSSPVFFIVLLFTMNGRMSKIEKTMEQGQRVIIKEVQMVVTPTTTPEPTKKADVRESSQLGEGKWVGKVSHYSRSGCLGCSKTLTMANGQPLDDEAMTIAFNWLPMNTRVRLTNIDTGASCEATVTDTGGFNRLNRIADLVPAVQRALGTKTDVTNVLIEKL